MFKTLQGLTRLFPGKWIYEVLISSQGLMQIGWCTINCRFNQEVPVERGPAQALAGLRQPPAQWGPLRTLTWTALWRRTVSHPIPGHRSPETALVPSLGASAPFSRAMWVQGWCLAGSGPAPPRSPDLTDGFSLGGGWRYTQLLRLRRQPGTQVERDHDELRKGEATSPTATCPLPLPRLSAGSSEGVEGTRGGTDSGPLSSGQSSLVQCRRRWGAAWAGPWAPAHLHGVLPWQAWAAGDIVSCLIDLDEGTLSFSL